HHGVTKCTRATTTSASYDGEGNKVATTNEIGATSTAEYTVFDKPVVFVDPTGAVTRVEYNTQMQPVRLINGDDRVWTYSYDLDGMLCGECDYNQIVTTTQRSVDGSVVTTTSPAGTTTYTFHTDGRSHTIADSLGVTTYHYDDYGRLGRVVGPQATIVYQRDEFGRGVAETVVLPSGESTTYATQVADTSGRISEETLTLCFGDAFSTRFHFDHAGQINATTHVHTPADREFSYGLAEVDYAVDQRGMRNRVSTGALVRSLASDIRGRVTGDSLSALDSDSPTGLRTLSSRLFTWRDDSALQSVTDFLRGVARFDLDLIGRATAVRRSVDPNNPPHVAGFGDEAYEFSTAGVLNAIDVATTSPATREHHMPWAPRPGDGVAAPRGVKADARIEFDGTMPTRVGRTTYTYDAAGRVVQTVTTRVSKKPLVHHFYYGTGEQPIGFETSDEPDVGYRYSYDPYGRRVAKEKLVKATGEVLSRTVFSYCGNQLSAQQVSYANDGSVGAGYVWTTDPATGEVIGQISLTASDRANRAQPVKVDATFMFVMTDLAGSPQEIVDPVDGAIVGYSTQTLYGVRRWHGECTSPLLFAGQYLDDESGWAYNRFRYYQPDAGIYNAQDPLGVTPRVASAQGYVDHAAHWVDCFGLESHVKIEKFGELTTTLKTDAGEITIKMVAYNAGQGHHTPMKALIIGAENATALQNGAPAIPIAELEKLNALPKFKGMTGAQIHKKITDAQHEAFLSADRSRIKTWDDARELDLEAHDAAQIPRAFSEPWIDAGIEYYTNNGIDKPTNFPWKGRIG
ncbi:RHS repeat domain-containing protein, partial [Corynebacterium sp. HMSC29G08]|uniref:RHS repeat domain-containing protein n=1 Tax=Corynebacterium sp. HMSC29G08 TaxID=1581069 RepID=UPI000A520705